ncbi:hypothetical protein EPO05_01050 [Patescibacteria group bacterium]|nr:MAG: hypothetical protein EPO05_01050 [Patescibacteria group bacterium]
MKKTEKTTLKKMTLEKFIRINGEEGISRSHAEGLWNSMPSEAWDMLWDTPEVEERLRGIARRHAGGFRMAELNPYPGLF